MSQTDPPPQRPTLAQVLLGAFIVWQLFFLAAFNLLQFRAHTRPLDQPDRPALARVVDRAEETALDGLGRYGQVTGQTQGWWMFALTLPESSFPLVELRWNGPDASPPRQLRSVFDPDDPANYFHQPGPRDRLFHYEMNLMLYNPQSQLKPEDVQKSARPALAYLRWRVELFQQENPELPPPSEAILYRRSYATPPREAASLQRPNPVDRPLFRWMPGREEAVGFLPVEAYDPAARRFVPVKDAP